MLNKDAKKIEKFFGIKPKYDANKREFINQVKEQAISIDNIDNIDKFAEEKWLMLSLKERQTGNFDDIINRNDFFDMNLHNELLKLNKNSGHGLKSYQEKVDDVHLKEFIDGVKLRGWNPTDEIYGMSMKELMKHVEKITNDNHI